MNQNKKEICNQKELKVGVIQTTLDNSRAWNLSPCPKPSIIDFEAKKAWEEIRHGFCSFFWKGEVPEIILLPELAVPQKTLPKLKRLAQELGSIVIAGLDYKYSRNQNTVKNQGVVIVPQSWPELKSCKRSVNFYFGKTYPAPEEKSFFDKLNLSFLPEPIIWLFDTDLFGKIGVCICYDFMDVERFIVYRNRLQHLFVIAYNKDIKAFQELAGCISRVVYCNVVICNTGKFGGSYAVSPLKNQWERVHYNHEGQNLFTQQMFCLPVEEMYKAQKDEFEDSGEGIKQRARWKARPPGFESDKDNTLKIRR